MNTKGRSRKTRKLGREEEGGGGRGLDSMPGSLHAAYEQRFLLGTCADVLVSRQDGLKKFCCVLTQLLDLMLSTLDAMTRSLRNQWGGMQEDRAGCGQLCTRSKHKSSQFLWKDQEKGEQEFNEVAPKGCHFDLHFSLKLLRQHFVKEFSYPLAFSPEMTDDERKEIPQYLFLAGHRWSYGYRHMSRFFCHDIFYLDVLQPFDYYWRLDADSTVFCFLPSHSTYLTGWCKTTWCVALQEACSFLTVFAKEYGYMVVTQEDEAVVKVTLMERQEAGLMTV
eukprot:760452-Hanusia_phi.AAC.1